MGSGFVNGKISAAGGEGNACGRAGYCTFLAIGEKRQVMKYSAIVKKANQSVAKYTFFRGKTYVQYGICQCHRKGDYDHSWQKMSS
jgi:hypothetical protein